LQGKLPLDRQVLEQISALYVLIAFHVHPVVPNSE
jgi:hypothetical protein